MTGRGTKRWNNKGPSNHRTLWARDWSGAPRNGGFHLSAGTREWRRGGVASVRRRRAQQTGNSRKNKQILIPRRRISLQNKPPLPTSLFLVKEPRPWHVLPSFCHLLSWLSRFTWAGFRAAAPNGNSNSTESPGTERQRSDRSQAPMATPVHLATASPPGVSGPAAQQHPPGSLQQVPALCMEPEAQPCSLHLLGIT